jgi:hypothetical protein
VGDDVVVVKDMEDLTGTLPHQCLLISTGQQDGVVCLGLSATFVGYLLRLGYANRISIRECAPDRV